MARAGITRHRCTGIPARVLLTGIMDRLTVPTPATTRWALTMVDATGIGAGDPAGVTSDTVMAAGVDTVIEAGRP